MTRSAPTGRRFLTLRFSMLVLAFVSLLTLTATLATKGQGKAQLGIARGEIKQEELARFPQLLVAPALIATVWRPWRPFQGWRYLLPGDAPPDRDAVAEEEPEGAPMPARMAAELRALGLL